MFLKAFFLGIIFICSALFLKAQPDAFTVVMPDGKETFLTVSTVNNNHYFSFKEIALEIFPGSTITNDGTEISFNDTFLRIAPSGHFVIYETSDEGITAKMALPALKIGAELYVPAPHFLETFETLHIYHVAKTSANMIRFYNRKGATKLTSNPFKSEPEKDFTPSRGPLPGSSPKSILQKSVDIYKPKLAPAITTLKAGWPSKSKSKVIPQKKSVVSEKAIVREAPKIDTVSLPRVLNPNYYMLPRDLRRRALERKKDGSFKSESGKIILQYASLYPVIEPKRIAITDIEVIEKKLSTEIVFKANGEIADYHKPELVKKNLTFRISDALILFKTGNLFKNHPLIQSFKSSQLRNYAVFTITLRDGVLKATTRRIGFNKIVLEIFKNQKKNVKKEEIAEPEEDDDKVLKEKSPKEKSAKDRWKLDVIVLDPGHGGEDHGATSINGFKEKDITLRIAKRVEQLLKKGLPDTKVVMTRRDDTFIELFRRGQIANESKGKLFISIHCNSMPKKPHKAHGFETYILRPGRNEDAVRVADRENAAVKFEDEQKRYKSMTDEQLIIATMAQSAFVKFSEHFAELLQKEVSKTTPLHSRGVSQAGFFVLVGASMPNVLFETAFLSNEDDEEFLSSEKGQQKMAEGITKAIERYAAEYGELLKNE
ncbi:MAG: N-acetylmuramoyl-L-alanine amidase [Bacteroidota bacterium]